VSHFLSPRILPLEAADGKGGEELRDDQRHAALDFQAISTDQFQYVEPKISN
jgi:hypothetical protein